MQPPQLQFAWLFLFYFFTWVLWYHGLPLLPSGHPAGWSSLDRVALGPLQGSLGSWLWSREGMYCLTLPALAGFYLALQGQTRWLRPLLAGCCLAKVLLLCSDLQLGHWSHGLHVALSLALLLEQGSLVFTLWTLVAVSWLNALYWFSGAWLSGQELMQQSGWPDWLCWLAAWLIWLASLVGPLGLLWGGPAFRGGKTALLTAHGLLWLAFTSAGQFHFEPGEWSEWLWLGSLACLAPAEETWERWQPSAWLVCLLLWQALGQVWLGAAAVPLSGPRTRPGVELTLGWPERLVQITGARAGWSGSSGLRVQGPLPAELGRWLQRNRRLLALPGMRSRLESRTGAVSSGMR